VYSFKTYFVQPCPVCGRSLHVPVQLLGQLAACSHCQGTFVARDPDAAQTIESDSSTASFDKQRVDFLLSQRQGEYPLGE
jgi:hypothetical protein